jgi:uncharacterized protein YneF (UPF0154 family)
MLCRQVRDRLRHELYKMYKNAENAYAALDFTGLGYVAEDVFLNSYLVRERLPFSKDQVQEYFKSNNLFAAGTKGLDFDTFKKNFFPNHYLVAEDKDDADDKQAFFNRQQIDTNIEKQPEIIEDRLQRLEAKLKTKFSNCYESVRKAFLALDTDYDGYITVEDILKYFGNEPDLNYNDLKKLMIDKDAKKQGRIGYSDFSKWLGSAIHMSEGFVFRHDSVKNPFYEMAVDKMNKSAMA